jgi:hypothetical protein
VSEALPWKYAPLVIWLMLSGCTPQMLKEVYTAQQVDNWAESHERLAESGRMPWSEYYRELYQQTESAPINNRSVVLEQLGILSTAAFFYEKGILTRADFESVRGIVKKLRTVNDPLANSLARDALAEKLQSAKTISLAPGPAAPGRP